MKDSREFYASNVDEAVEKAAKSLGISPGELSYEVLDEGSEGFLGIGARDARIRVVVPSTANEDGTHHAPEAVSTPDAGGENGRTDVLGSDGAEAGEQAPEELLEEIRGFSSEVIEGMGLGGRIDVYDAGEYIAVDVSSDHTALLIGQKGETIDSLQYLMNVSIYRRRPFVKRIVLDSEGYRQRRIEAIQGMAHRTARKAVRENRPIKMPPMNPSERRVVHVYLKDNPKVTTFSEGRGENRRVTVSPA